MSGPKWKPAVPGVEFKSGKLITFGRSAITVDKAWPPRSWCRTAKQPWRHGVPTFAVVCVRDRVLLRRFDSLRASYFVTPAMPWFGRKRKGLSAYVNPDGTIGTPFETGWHSRLPGQKDKLLLFRGAMRKSIATIQFQLTIPEPARMAVKPFHWSQQAALLGLLARGGSSAFDLVKSNPCLAVALANYGLFVKGATKPWRSAVALLKRRQRDIAAKLGFPGTGAAVKLLRKINPKDITARQLLFLRGTLLRHPDMAVVFAHLQHIASRELMLGTMPSLCSKITPAFLVQVSELPPLEWGPIDEIRDTKRMGRQLFGRSWTVGPFRSLAQLKQVHDRLAALCAKRQGSDEPFVEPPVPGDEMIRPLCSPMELNREGEAMKNCAGSYDDQVRDGLAYLYHVTLPGEECTLSLAPAGFGTWRLGELKGIANKKASSQAKKLVLMWLEIHQGLANRHLNIGPLASFSSNEHGALRNSGESPLVTAAVGI